jgi:ABC-type uncharacterized transport system permease subunit
MQSDRSYDWILDVLMSYLLPLAGVAVVAPALLQTALPAWAAWVIAIPAGVAAGWAVSIICCCLLTALHRL